MGRSEAEDGERAAILVRDGKARASAPPENSCLNAIAALRQPVSRTPTKRRPGLAGELAQNDARRSGPICRARIGSAADNGEADSVLLVQLMADPFAHCSCAVLEQVIIEVCEVRHKRQEFDPCGLRAVGQNAERRVACRIPVARDIEALQSWRELHG